jgi:hypothetical protein
MPISNDQLVGLTKQVFMLEYLINGLFPCQSDVFRLIRAKKREWKFNDKFEYRMLLAVTNTGGSLNSQVFNSQTLGLNKPGQLEYGTYRATYGNVSDGFEVDMMLNLETKEKVAAFENDYATRMHSLRTNVASLAKNFGIHGQFGVVHQIRKSIDDDYGAPNLPSGYKPMTNVGSVAGDHGGANGGDYFTIRVPINVFQSNFKTGKLLIKTKGPQPWAAADVEEMYMVLDNQPGYLTLLSVGTKGSLWNDGDFLEVAQNREAVGASPTLFQSWSWGAINISSGPFAGDYDKFTGTVTNGYTNGTGAIVGAMEGLADLFPWYMDPNTPGVRLGLDRAFRDQPDRMRFSTEQAGGWVYQQDSEHIIDAIMRGVMLTKNTVPYADIMMFMNEYTRQAMGYEEAGNVRVLRDNFIEGPIVYQRGVKSTDYQIGNSVIKEVIEDNNMPTDVILIGPKLDMAYNCWDNSIFQIDDYIQETWSKQKPPAIEDMAIPDEFLTKLDLSNRITYGPPTLVDGGLANFANGNRIRHPKNAINVALHEMGALFTEYPYTYTVVKLQAPICDLKTT